jgi:predicted ATPase
LSSLGKIEPISSKFPKNSTVGETEIATLLTAFQRVATADENSSHTELMLVTGYSGMGKTTLVREIYQPITEKRGFFISGKFDQFQRDIPYAAVVSALTNLVKQLLGKVSHNCNYGDKNS